MKVWLIFEREGQGLRIDGIVSTLERALDLVSTRRCAAAEMELDGDYSDCQQFVMYDRKHLGGRILGEAVPPGAARQ